MTSEKSKYERWYDAIIESGRNRTIPVTYTEVHHIKPRSHGGGDDPSNLVRLTYREHFLVHWLLLKICKGDQLRKMQIAMFAMTMPLWGNRIISGWQFDVAKRTAKDYVIANSFENAFIDAHHEKRRRAREEQLLVDAIANGRWHVVSEALVRDTVAVRAKLGQESLPDPEPFVYAPSERRMRKQRNPRPRPRPSKRAAARLAT